MTTTHTILIADDDAATVEMMARYLVSLGFSVQSAYDGEEALEILRQGCEYYSAVLLDIAMPRMSGFKLAQAVRGELACDIPLIALTARASFDLIDEATAAGITTVLTKPFKPTALRALLAEVGLLNR